MGVDRELERWVYLGRRLVRDGGIAHQWRDPNNETRLFKKFVGRVIGGVYAISVERTDEGVAVFGEPVWTGDRVDDTNLVAGWEASDRHAYESKAAAAAEKRASIDSALAAACADLEAIAAACKTWGEAEAVAAVVRTRLMKAWGKR